MAGLEPAIHAWSIGRSSGGPEFGDYFAYAVVAERACPLLFVGNDLTRTDLRSVL
jgi:ribonuclease VapC